MNTSSARQRFRSAEAAFQRGDYASTVRLLADDEHGHALHLRGLAERRSGQPESALRSLRAAAQALPADAAIARNYGLAARTAGRREEALQAFRRATEIAPRFAAGWQSRGRAAFELELFPEAEDAFGRATTLEPSNVPGRFGLAQVLIETGRTSAARQILERLSREGRTDASILFLLGRCAIADGRLQQAIEQFGSAHQLDPTGLTLRTLAEALWMTGEKQSFVHLITTAADRPQLVALAADLARQAGELPLATRLLNKPGGDSADGFAVRALVGLDEGDAVAADEFAQRALAGNSNHRPALAALLSSRLMQGRGADALALIAPVRAAEPDNQHWLAFEATALRLTDATAYKRLLDEGRLIREFELPVPPGYADIAAFNKVLLAELDKERLFVQRPLAQSLRGGNQTANDLLAMASPVVDAYLDALRTPVARYLNELGVAADHPLVARRTSDFRISECWSVELQTKGYHVSHVHPRGWLSSAYYVAVPPADDETRARREGWIKFGEPPFPTQPPLEPERWIEPREGIVVLFPSFVWHGTVPFTAGSRRVTAPFDILPA